MTANQINYLSMLENKRHNLTTEQQTKTRMAYEKKAALKGAKASLISAQASAKQAKTSKQRSKWEKKIAKAKNKIEKTKAKTAQYAAETARQKLNIDWFDAATKRLTAKAQQKVNAATAKKLETEVNKINTLLPAEKKKLIEQYKQIGEDTMKQFNENWWSGAEIDYYSEHPKKFEQIIKKKLREAAKAEVDVRYQESASDEKFSKSILNYAHILYDAISSVGMSTLLKGFGVGGK